MANLNLQDLLNVCPNHWDSSDYSEKSYVLIEISQHTSEYQEVLNMLEVVAGGPSSLNYIKKIERIQHPFAYCRYVLRQEQLRKRGCDIPSTPIKIFYNVELHQVHEAIQYNLDARRHRNYVGHDYLSDVINKCIIVVESLKTSYGIERDSEYYPIYAIYYENN